LFIEQGDLHGISLSKVVMFLLSNEDQFEKFVSA